MIEDTALASRLNRDCACLAADLPALGRDLDDRLGTEGGWEGLAAARPHLFAATPLFVARRDVERMEAVVRAVEAAARLPGHVETALSRAPSVARFDPGPLGAFMGYDFHLGTRGPRLIEVNSNAGGAFLNAAAARTSAACCGSPAVAGGAGEFPASVMTMFEAEWRLQRGEGRPARIAIVDGAPEAQYLYPEFRLAARLFRDHGIDATIADPAALTYADGRLSAEGRPIDLVYNRLVDFALERPEHAALRAAYLDGAVVVTPNPRVHALLADKRNLIQLSDGEYLRAMGLDEDHARALDAAVPRTVAVTADNADALWRERNALFFKPAAGHGGKAAYRGDKITKTVWARIAAGGYVAQTFAPPGERVVRVGGEARPLKADVRLYTYAGRTLLVAARLYQGQTTNFRTPGGGFAPVLVV